MDDQEKRWTENNLSVQSVLESERNVNKKANDSMKDQHKINGNFIEEVDKQPETLNDFEMRSDDVPQHSDDDYDVLQHSDDGNDVFQRSDDNNDVLQRSDDDNDVLQRSDDKDLPQLGDDDVEQENNSVENLKCTEDLLEKDHDSVELKIETNTKDIPGGDDMAIDDNFSDYDLALLSDIEDDIKVEHVQDENLDSTESETQKLLDLVNKLDRYSCTLCDFQATNARKLRKHIISSKWPAKSTTDYDLLHFKR